jgi:hypothetical protein
MRSPKGAQEAATRRFGSNLDLATNDTFVGLQRFPDDPPGSYTTESGKGIDGNDAQAVVARKPDLQFMATRRRYDSGSVPTIRELRAAWDRILEVDTSGGKVHVLDFHQRLTPEDHEFIRTDPFLGKYVQALRGWHELVSRKILTPEERRRIRKIGLGFWDEPDTITEGIAYPDPYELGVPFTESKMGLFYDPVSVFDHPSPPLTPHDYGTRVVENFFHELAHLRKHEDGDEHLAMLAKMAEGVSDEEIIPILRELRQAAAGGLNVRGRFAVEFEQARNWYSQRFEQGTGRRLRLDQQRSVELSAGRENGSIESGERPESPPKARSSGRVPEVTAGSLVEPPEGSLASGPNNEGDPRQLTSSASDSLDRSVLGKPPLPNSSSVIEPPPRSDPSSRLENNSDFGPKVLPAIVGSTGGLVVSQSQKSSGGNDHGGTLLAKAVGVRGSLKHDTYTDAEGKKRTAKWYGIGATPQGRGEREAMAAHLRRRRPELAGRTWFVPGVGTGTLQELVVERGVVPAEVGNIYRQDGQKWRSGGGRSGASGARAPASAGSYR